MSVCEVPGCEEEARGKVSLYADGWDGGLYAGFCIAHLFGLVNVWPQLLDGLAGKLP